MNSAKITENALVRHSSVPKKIEKKIHHNMECNCAVCIKYYAYRNKYQNMSSTPNLRSAISRSKQGTRPVKAGFTWFLEQLAELDELHVGVMLKIPETAIWKDGAPKFILKYIGGRFIKLLQKKMTPHFVLINFSANQQEEDLNRPGSRDSSKKSITSGTRKSSTKILISAPQPIPDSGYFRATIREIVMENGIENNFCKTTARLLTEKELFTVLNSWTRDQLKKISILQTNTKVFGSRPHVIRVGMKYPLQIEKLKKSAKQLTLAEIRRATCKEILRKICQAIYDKTRIEILELKAEFLTTETEYLLNDVWEILWHTVQLNGEKEQKEDYSSYMMNANFLEKLVGKLDIRELSANKEKILSLDSITGTIDQHIKNIRQYTGVNDGLKEEAMDNESNRAFSSLRPYCPYKFSDLTNDTFKFDTTNLESFGKITPQARKLPREKLIHALLFEDNSTSIKYQKYSSKLFSSKYSRTRAKSGLKTTSGPWENQHKLFVDIRSARSTMNENENRKKRFFFEKTNWREVFF